MTKLEYIIKGFGIRGFHVTKHEWEVRRNVYLPVKKDEDGCISVFDGEVRAGSMPKELQETFREFLKTPTSKIQVKAKSVQPVDKGIGKGQEIPCVIKLIGEDRVVERNNIAAIKEGKNESDGAVNNMRKSRGDKNISIRKVWSTNKYSTKGEWMDNNTTRPDESKTNERKLGSSKKNKNNSSKRKRDDEYLMADGSSPKIKKTRASTSTESTEKEEFDKKISGRNKQAISWDQRKISDVDCNQLSEHIGDNWELLGAEFGLGQVQIDHIKEDNRTTQKKIKDMLCLWKKKSKDARICDFLRALKVYRSVNFDESAINDYFRKYQKC